MTVENMHYDFKQKLNKIDSQKYRNLLIPEIDWKLNEAQEIFIKTIAQPRLRNLLGFESNQRTISDIRKIVVNQDLTNTCITPIQIDSKTYLSPIPSDYWFYADSYVTINKAPCGEKQAYVFERQHGDLHEKSNFDESSYEWEEINARYNEDGIRLFTDGTFTITKHCLNYIRRPLYIHYANGTSAGQYRLPDNTLLVGKQDCELSEHTHREIVDLAVMITTGDLQIPDYNVKVAKTKLNN